MTNKTKTNNDIINNNIELGGKNKYETVVYNVVIHSVVYEARSLRGYGAVRRCTGCRRYTHIVRSGRDLLGGTLFSRERDTTSRSF